MDEKQIRDLIGDPRVIREELRRFSADARYFANNYERLRQQYHDEWVAIYERRVIGHGRDQSGLVEQLRKEGIDTGKVYMDRTYFNEEEPTWVLPAA